MISQRTTETMRYYQGVCTHLSYEPINLHNSPLLLLVVLINDNFLANMNSGIIGLATQYAVAGSCSASLISMMEVSRGLGYPHPSFECGNPRDQFLPPIYH
jgi:hypothetical protein